MSFSYSDYIHTVCLLNLRFLHCTCNCACNGYFYTKEFTFYSKYTEVKKFGLIKLFFIILFIYFFEKEEAGTHLV